MFPTIRIDRNRAEAVEPLGTKRKFWFSEQNKRMLFKAEERGTGEDWAEKLACELCRRIGLPHVDYDLAEEYNGDDYLHPGVVCPHCAPSPESLVLGNQLLLAQDPAYPRQDHRKYRVSVYTVEAVLQCLQKLDPPSWRWIAAVPAGIVTALDVFVGYVMLDAWVANQDRHHENWAAIVAPEDKKLRLAPTFDHGASRPEIFRTRKGKIDWKAGTRTGRCHISRVELGRRFTARLPNPERSEHLKRLPNSPKPRPPQPKFGWKRFVA